MSTRLHPARRAAWHRVRQGVVSRQELLEAGFSSRSIQHRIAKRWLHPIWPGVYAVGRRDLTDEGWWRAAVLASGGGAALSHLSAATLWGIFEAPIWPIHVSIPVTARRSLRGIEHHRRTLLPCEITEHRDVPVTSVPAVIADLAARMPRGRLEGVVNEASIRGLVTPPELRAAIDAMPRRPGRAVLRETLDRRTFRFTRSQLERAFIPLALSAGLPRPETCVMVNGWEVDFYWPELNLVVEADSLTYHGTPQQQARDRLRDQAHAAAGTERLRITHSQIRYEARYVRGLLITVARRLARAGQVGRQLEQVGHR